MRIKQVIHITNNEYSHIPKKDLDIPGKSNKQTERTRGITQRLNNEGRNIKAWTNKHLPELTVEKQAEDLA